MLPFLQKRLLINFLLIFLLTIVSACLIVNTMDGEFAIALSEKSAADAAKEVSLKIKSVFPKTVKSLFIFFTPQYHPQEILNVINFTLKPQNIIGLQSPFLNYEERVIEEGITAFAINKEGVDFKEISIKDDAAQSIESSLRMSLKNFSREESFFMSFLSQKYNYRNYLRGFELAMGRSLNVFGAGFIKKYAAKNYQIINNNISEGLISIMGSGIEISSLSIGGFIPLGRPFTITKTINSRSMIMEIDGKPAINIYRNYLGTKFDIFMKNHLFSLYPIGIHSGNKIHLINVIECLDDGSLACIGNTKENVKGHILLFHSQAFAESLKSELENIKKHGDGLVFMVNSMVRKRILKDYAQEESRIIKQFLGDKFKIIGIYSDYSFFSEMETREINLESGNILMTLWK